MWSRFPLNLKRFDEFGIFNDDASTKFKQSLDIGVQKFTIQLSFKKSVEKILTIKLKNRKCKKDLPLRIRFDLVM